MASLGILCGGAYGGLDHRFLSIHSPCDQTAGPRSLVVDCGRGMRGRSARTSLSTTTSSLPMKKNVKHRGYGGEVIQRDKLDRWMKDSVVDIVKNLREAPLFLRFYTTEEGEAARFETEKAVAKERWPILEDQWESGATPTPEGIMFVQELEDDQVGDGGSKDTDESKAWGIVIQGRAVERGAPVCYLLKTSSVPDVGLWCTHFCLVKVKDFRETTKSQLQNCWLLQ